MPICQDSAILIKSTLRDWAEKTCLDLSCMYEPELWTEFWAMLRGGEHPGIKVRMEVERTTADELLVLLEEIRKESAK